uniref:Uncharacterized protein n=2 Tax=Cyprinus carpio TaxID=7962 RepID=A0A8C1Q0L3_CYPCA
MEQFTMAVYVIRKEGGHHKPPADIGVVIKAVKVLNELPSFTSACALLLGMIYINNLAYPKPLRFTFEVFQKVLLQLDQHKMSPKVQSLFRRLQCTYYPFIQSYV